MSSPERQARALLSRDMIGVMLIPSALPLVLAGLAALAALVLAWRSRAARPIAGVLVLALAVDALRSSATLPPEMSMGLFLATPAASCAAARAVLARRSARPVAVVYALVLALVCWTPLPPGAWLALPPAAHGLALLVQLHSAWRWIIEGEEHDHDAPPARLALVLLAGDVSAALFGPTLTGEGWHRSPVISALTSAALLAVLLPRLAAPLRSRGDRREARRAAPVMGPADGTRSA